MTTSVMNVNQFARYAKKLGTDFMPAVKRGMLSGALRAIPTLQERTRSAPPASPRGKMGAFDTGAYHAAWKSEVIANGVSLRNARPYAGVIEYGRRPAPVSVEGMKTLEGWAKRKLGVSGAEARAAAFAIAQSMRTRPLAARKVITDGLTRITKLIEDEVRSELDKLLKARGLKL